MRVTRALVLTLTLSCSMMAGVLSFLSPQTCSFSSLGQAPIAKVSVLKRQAATAIPGGVPSGSLEKKREPKEPISLETEQPPGAQPNEIVATKEAKTAVTAALGKGESSIEPKADGGTVAAQGAKAAVSSDTKEMPTAVVTATAAGQAEEPAMTLKDRAPASPESMKKKEKGKDEFTAQPETTAAEKVLTLLDIGLVDKEEAAAYYEALSELERTTREAKAAKAVAADAPVSRPRPSSTFIPQEGPLSLVPFPAACAALGAAGTHALHLTGGLGTAISFIGALAGVAVGSLVVVGDDAGGRAARAAGSAVAGAAGKGLSDSVGGAAGYAVSFAEEAIVKAPANLINEVAKTVSSAVMSGVSSVLNLPRALAAKAVDGAKGALQDTSKVVAGIPVEVAKKATEAAGGALQSTSEVALSAVKESPKEAAKLLKEAVSGPGETLTAFVSRATVEGVGKREKQQKVQPKTSRSESPVASPSEQEEEGEIPVEELEAKLLSVKQALERFDDVKNRIEEAHTSNTLLETVGITRSIDMSAERERAEEARAAARTAADIRTERKESTGSRSTDSESKPRAVITDQERRKQVADRLLEMASQRATEAKAGLKAAAASAQRGNLDEAALQTAAADAGSERQAPREPVASR